MFHDALVSLLHCNVHLTIFCLVSEHRRLTKAPKQKIGQLTFIAFSLETSWELFLERSTKNRGEAPCFHSGNRLHVNNGTSWEVKFMMCFHWLSILGLWNSLKLSKYGGYCPWECCMDVTAIQVYGEMEPNRLYVMSEDESHLYSVVKWFT